MGLSQKSVWNYPLGVSSVLLRVSFQEPVLVPNAVELEWHLKWFNVISSDVNSLNLKKDRTRIGLSFQVTYHIKIFWTDCELIPELNSLQREIKREKVQMKPPLYLIKRAVADKCFKKCMTYKFRFNFHRTI